MELTNAAKYERTNSRKGYRSGHYTRKLQTTSGNISLKVPKLKGIPHSPRNGYREVIGAAEDMKEDKEADMEKAKRVAEKLPCDETE